MDRIVKGNGMTKTSECRCFIRHAITPKERKAVAEAMEYSRSIGDMRGVQIALMQLGECKTAERTTD